MTLRQPPAIAGQLLKRLVPAHDHDALLGDLSEDFQHDRSAFWYWAQIVAAIVVGSFRDMRAHWVLALRSIAIGAASFVAYFQVVGIWILNNFHPVVPASLLPWIFFLAGFVWSGWIIGRSHRAYGITLVIPFAAAMGVLGLTDLARSAMNPHAWTLWLLLKPLLIPFAILLGGYRAAVRVEAA